MSDDFIKNNPHIGSSFESWLYDEGIYEEVTRIAREEVARMLNQLEDWVFPIKGKEILFTFDSESFVDKDYTKVVEVPLLGHCGSFAFERKNHIHEGVDLYAPIGEPIYAVEDGVVVNVEHFTGQYADPPSTWWNDTQAVLIQGRSGVVVYGEIEAKVVKGQEVKAGDLVGNVLTVLKKDKGRPMSMLHLELYETGATMTHPWDVGAARPPGLKDPTQHLLKATGYYKDF